MGEIVFNMDDSTDWLNLKIETIDREAQNCVITMLTVGKGISVMLLLFHFPFQIAAYRLVEMFSPYFLFVFISQNDDNCLNGVKRILYSTAFHNVVCFFFFRQ